MTEMLTNPEPLFRVEGQEVKLTQSALDVRIEETTEGLRTLRARLVAQGPKAHEEDEPVLYLDGQVIDFGKKIEVSLGAAGDARTVFTGVISALEAEFRADHEPVVQLFAEDALMKLRMTRRSRTYTQASDGDIARQVAGFHGLTPAVSADGPTYDYVQQWNQSDLAFLRERARRIQAELWVDGDTLHFKTRPNRNATQVTLHQGTDLVEVRLRADLAHQRTSVKVSGYDASQRDTVEKQASDAALQAEVSGGRTGMSILGRALQGDHTSFHVRDVPLKSDEAEAWAKAELLRRARAFVTVEGTTHGTPDLQVGSRLTLQGVGRPFNGAGYYVTRLCHVWSRTTHFHTYFEAERPTLSEAA